MKKSVGHAFSDHVFEERVKYRRGFSGKPSRELFAAIPLLILGAVFVLLLLRLFTLQVVRANYYSRLSDENRIRNEIISAPRGVIFDSESRALVRNSPAFSILRDNKVEFLPKDEALRRLAKGEAITQGVIRDYLYGETFAHVLGYIGQINSNELLLPDFTGYGISDFTGRMGLEEQYEKILHGQNGRKLYEVDAKGERVRLLGEDQPVEGGVIHTTLNLDIQQSVAKSMQDVERGAVVISDPRDGSILSLYSKPSFDPNLFTRDPSYEAQGKYKKKEDVLLDGEKFPLLNRTVSGVYPPGSTYKLITSIAALETKAITEDTEIEDTGVVSIGGSTFGTWNWLQNGKKEGALDVRGALKRSNDIFYYKASEKIGIDKLDEWSKEFYLGEKLGIDIPGEVAGTLPSAEWKKKVLNENWYLGDTYNMSIGQGYMESTPLQVNMYTTVFANGGELYQPHLIKDGTKLLKKDFVTKEYVAIVKDGMKQACQTGGTAYPFFNFSVRNNNLSIDGLDFIEGTATSAATIKGNEKLVGITTGCKTGTSESHGFDADPHAWFTIFAPYYNPEIVVTVLVENGGEGSEKAAPIAKEILTSYFEKK